MAEDGATRIVQLEKRVADLKARLPKHSIPPAMLIELEELEEELMCLKAEQGGEACAWVPTSR